MFEKEFVDWLEGRKKKPLQHSTRMGIGDDAAVLALHEHSTVVTTDTLCDQVHFDSSIHSLERIGRKAVAVSISDVLAMGGRPTQALLTFFLPKQFNLEDAKRLFVGAETLASTHDVDIVGGDTNSYEGPLIIGTTVLGEVDPQRTWTVSNALVGDCILVTGRLGGSILGKHLDFEPRVDWVQTVAKEYEVDAATDVTDSLSLDLQYICQRSGVGCELDANAIPISDDAIKLAADSGKTPLEHALTDGEDFELVLCVNPAIGRSLIERFPTIVSVIGKVVEESGMRLKDPSGNVSEYFAKGYEH